MIDIPFGRHEQSYLDGTEGSVHEFFQFSARWLGGRDPDLATLPSDRKATTLHQGLGIETTRELHVQRFAEEIDEWVTPEFSQNLIELLASHVPECDQNAAQSIASPTLVLECPFELFSRQESASDERLTESLANPDSLRFVTPAEPTNQHRHLRPFSITRP